MPTRNFKAILLIACSAMSLGAMAATTASGIAFESGGASVEEFTDINSRASSYSLKLLMTSRGSGAYIADVDVQVRAKPSGPVVLEHRSEGPLLLAALPPGRYEVTARYADVRPGAPTQITRTVTVPRSGRVQALLQFDTDDVVSTDSPAEYRSR